MSSNRSKFEAIKIGNYGINSNKKAVKKNIDKFLTYRYTINDFRNSVFDCVKELTTGNKKNVETNAKLEKFNDAIINHNV